MYGNGEQNDIFYEFFRRAWVSLHPQLAALPVVGKGDNNLPTIHVSDLSNAIDRTLLHGQEFNSYLIAVDQSTCSTQRNIQTAISKGIGSGEIHEAPMAEVVNESWCEFMTINVKLETSPDLLEGFEWKCPTGINGETMPMLNEEFNYFRGLFPLKVFITGPPCSGKTYFAAKLNELYGVPHYQIQDLLAMGLNLQSEFGDQLRGRIEEMKDAAAEEYMNGPGKKKGAPPFDRDNCHPRLSDDYLAKLVQIQLSSAACQNKGFILEGFPRSQDDAKAIFTYKREIKKEVDPAAEDGGEVEPEYEEILDEKIVPQYAIAIEADDASLVARAKELPPAQTEGTHHNDAGMVRRLKEYRARNVEDSGATVKDFFTQAIGYPNVLIIDSMTPESEQLLKMKEIIE